MSERNLYEVTGDIKDINTMLVSREEWNRRAQPAQAGQVLTDEQIQSVYLENMLYQDGLTPSGMVRVTRAIERAQAVIAKGGIVGEKGGA